ncbi:transposase [Anabaena minutissima FACHB-250]|nr:transposase [Anabaena minutissima FACHB-250]
MNTTIPVEIASVLLPFAAVFTKPVWCHVQTLVMGAILTTGKRTITSVLVVMGLNQEEHFQNYHRVLNRAVWSSLEASRILLMLMVTVFLPSGPVIMGIDDTIERRKGKKIKAKGIYRDPVRSSNSQVVKVSGLRWLSMMLLVEISWAGRVWALPFLTVLAPSERYSQQYKLRHKKLIDWARQIIFQIKRWLPNRELVVVADSSFAALELLAAVSQAVMPVHIITRLRLDAALYEPAPERTPNTMGRPRLKGTRLPNLEQVLVAQQTQWQTIKVNRWYGEGERQVEVCTGTAVWYHTGLPVVPIRWVLVRDPLSKFESQALLSTNQEYSPKQILEWFVRRWQIEVTFEEVRKHLGMETQRQWSDQSIARTTPTLLGLFSLVVILADHLQANFSWTIKQTIWYSKALPTFSDALALVRRFLWASTFSTSSETTQMIKVPRLLFERLRDIAVYAA